MQKLSLFLLCCLLIFSITENAQAQANKTNSGDVVCPASGTSIEVIAARSGRYSYVLNNTSGSSIRVGFLSSGTGNLTTSNSLLIQAGQPYSDSVPGVYSGRVVCMSTTAGTATISFNETYR